MWIFIKFYQMKKQNILIQNNSDYKNMMNKIFLNNFIQCAFLYLFFL